MNTQPFANTPKNTSKLVDAKGLLEALFDEQSRPSIRWVWSLTRRRRIPFIKCGHLVRFNVEAVREHLERKATIQAR